MAKPSDAIDPISGPVNTAARDERQRALMGGRSLLLLIWLALLPVPLLVSTTMLYRSVRAF